MTGAVADLVGLASFEGAIWPSSTSGDGVGGDGIDLPPAMMDLSGEEGVDAIQRAMFESVDSAADVAAESTIVEGVMEALIEEVGEIE